MDASDFGARMLRWYEHGHLAVDGKTFDVGVQTASALRAIARGVPAARAASADPIANGNGSLMRVLPLALWHRGTDADLVRDARTSSVVTHAHARSQLCCALYCLWIRRLLECSEAAWEEATAALRGLLTSDEDLAELEFHIRPDLAPSGQGSGYVVDTLRSARMVQTAGSFESVLKRAVALGFDTDTTAAVAGGAAGARDGVAAIPRRWRQALRGQELVRPLLDELLGLRAS
jgi:ADP-ribosyl-[dinitrogen reductase] hydrolase